jgi:hypothetical protein
MNEAEQIAFRKKGELARIARKREQADASESVSGVTPGVTLADILKACVPALDATFPHDGSPDYGARLSACAILLSCFGRTLRNTPEDTIAIMRAIFTGTKHEALIEVDPTEPFRALRAEWYQTRVQVDSLGTIFIEALPHWTIGPGESRSQIEKNEPQDFTGWRVERLRNETGRELREHVRLIKPNGEVFGLVPRSDVPLAVLEAQGAFREPTDVRRL